MQSSFPIVFIVFLEDAWFKIECFWIFSKTVFVEGFRNFGAILEYLLATSDKLSRKIVAI